MGTSFTQSAGFNPHVEATAHACRMSAKETNQSCQEKTMLYTSHVSNDMLKTAESEICKKMLVRTLAHAALCCAANVFSSS